jgi:serine/threonine protein kinase
MMTWAPEHAAPELLRGESAGTATDVYGLGSVIATALSGRSPFREGPDDRVDAMLRRKMSGTPPLLASGPDDLNALVTRCLVPEPADRPSLDVVARELTRLQSAGVEPARTTSTTTDPGADVPDHDERVFGPVYVGALIVLLTCLLFAALFFGLG